MDKTPPRVLTIAGSDSGGGAGIQADLKVMEAHKVYGMSAITAVTSQNTLGVDGVQVMSPDFVSKQIEAVISDLGVDVIKTGMLATQEIVSCVAAQIKKHGVEKTVVDPVMIATSGSSLLDEKAHSAYIRELLPLAYVLTPNVPEAIQLVAAAEGKQREEIEANTLDDMRNLARRLHKLGPKNVLVKGGHLPFTKDCQPASSEEEKEIVVDVLFDGEQFYEVETPYSFSKNTHGTGCSLASAIASNLALSHPVPDAVRHAVYYVEGSINHSYPELGQGHGPLNHAFNTQRVPFVKGRFLYWLLEHPRVKGVWREYTHHEFVEQLGKGTLPIECFKYYLQQDYLYLVQFARANALAAYKATNMPDITASAEIILHIAKEMELHISYCAEFGLSRDDLENGKESMQTLAYSRYILDIGTSQSWLALQVALAACLHGYHHIAARLHASPSTVRGSANPYWKWIENYVAEDYVQAVERGRELLERHVWAEGTTGIEGLVEIFGRATELEAGFWGMGLAGPPGWKSGEEEKQLEN
ncbi:hypothetical protein SAICODRAFT_54115 [Saitoella complicata NRRL Y-17804]|nr:uncharacterized protein SAICODRAFT_54115 [Saitoella complicata NRRL Y-17804]ODQ54722.1 hypothetical protein SAICODRAFT_54115 [Saitoella complicata NRRL Y-17804]